MTPAVIAAMRLKVDEACDDFSGDGDDEGGQKERKWGVAYCYMCVCDKRGKEREKEGSVCVCVCEMREGRGESVCIYYVKNKTMEEKASKDGINRGIRRQQRLFEKGTTRDLNDHMRNMQLTF